MEEWVRRFRRTRSQRHFEALYDRCAARLYGMALHLSGGASADAEELVQETWLRAIARIDEFRGEAAFTTWLTGILINCNRERLRKTAPALRNEAKNGQPNELAGDLEAALARLSPGYREILLLHDLAGYTHAEIATHFGIAEGTSKSQLSRARAAVRASLADRNEKS